MNRHSDLRQLTLIQWNARSLRPKKATLQSLLQDNRVDVFAISETKLLSTDNFSLQNYDLFSYCRDRRGGGVMLGVHKSLKVTPLVVDDAFMDPIEAVGCTVDTGEQKLSFFSVYIPPGVHFRAAQLRQLLTSSVPIVVMGDFNSHSTSWGCRSSDARSKLIIDVSDDLNLSLLNDGSLTRLPPPSVGDAPSAIDLTLVSASLVLNCDWKVLGFEYFSDHAPILVRVGFSSGTIRRHRLRRSVDLTKNIDFQRYNLLVYLSLASIKEAPIDMQCELFTKSMYDSAMAAQTIPVPSPFIYSYEQPCEWWNAECDRAKDRYRQAEREFRTNTNPVTGTEYELAQNEFDKITRRAKEKAWQARCESFSDRTKLSELWRLARHYRKGMSPPRTQMDSEVMSQFIAKTTPDFVPNVPRYDSLIREYEDATHLADPFTRDELSFAIAKAKNNAPGTDRIKALLLRHLPNEALDLLLTIFNHILSSTSTPPAWNEAKVVVLLKPGKDPANVDSYRPICLLQSVRKLFERMLLTRLDHWAEVNEMLSPFQDGFRKGRGVNDCHARLTNAIHTAFERKQSCAVAFLDIKGAYDNVLVDVLLQDLFSKGIPRLVVDTIWSLMCCRTLVFEDDFGTVVTRCAFKGLPQGDSLSPLLYNLYTASMHAEASESTQIHEYADDVALACAHKDPKVAMSRLRRSTVDIFNWYATRGLDVSLTKTVVVVFSRKHELPNFRFSINGTDLPVQQDFNYLGVNYDRKMLRRVEVENKRSRCLKRLNFLKAISGVWWGANPYCMLRLYKSTILSVLEFGCISFASTTARTHLLKLEKIQWSALRVAGGFLMSTHTRTMEVVMGVPPLQVRYSYLFSNFLLSVFAHKKSMIVESFEKLVSVNTNHPRVVEFLRVKSLLPLPMSQPSMYHFELEACLAKPSVDCTIRNALIGVPKSLYPTVIRSAFLECSERVDPDVVVYTDGSVSSEGVGVGVFGPEGRELSLSCPTPTSVFSAEMLALNFACKSLMERERPCRALIVSDSQSSLSALVGHRLDMRVHPRVYDTRRIIHELSRRGFCITLAWTPSHCGLQGNETADGLATLGASAEERAIDFPFFNDFKPLLRKFLMSEWGHIWVEDQMGRFAHSIFPQIRGKPWFQDLDYERRDIVFINRIITNHTRLRTHLNRIDIIDDPLCLCGDEYETIDHLLWRCPRIDRTDIVRKLNLKGISENTPTRDILGMRGFDAMKEIRHFFDEQEIVI